MRNRNDRHARARGLACLLLLVTLPALAQLPPPRIPSDPGEVLEQLPPGFSRASARRPGTRAPQDQISTLLAMAASTGDARLAARAERMLRDYPADTRDADVIRARAFVAQHDHQFPEAIAQLDRLVSLNPRDGRALLARSQIHLVQGALQPAGRDCAALALGVDATLGALCTAALSLRRGRYDAAARLAERAQASADTPELRRHVLVLRGEIASRARTPDADRWFLQALQVAPTDVRTLAAYARHLRQAGRHADVERLLARAPATDALLLERALAAHASRRPEAATMAASLERRFARARAAGDEPELRDEAELALTLRGDAPRALSLALANFRTQRDVEDVDLLVRSAGAARRPDALAELGRWARETAIPLPGAAR